MNKLTLSLFVLLAYAISANSFAFAGASISVLFNSKPYESSSSKEVHFEDNMQLKPGQEQMPLTLVVRNGEPGKPGFNWFRLNIAGYLLATEKDMAGKNEASIDVSGQIQPGGGQILIDAAGEAGAELSFSLVAPGITLTSVQPSTSEPGQPVVLSGRNFSSNEAQDAAFIDSTPMQILSASSRSITAVIPKTVTAGSHQVKVVVNSLESGTRPVQVSSFPAPVLLGTNYWMAPPGAQLIITGKNFAANPSDNQVYFRNVGAQIVSASPDSITVVIPQWEYSPAPIGSTNSKQLNVPITVVSNGVRSVNMLRFDFGTYFEGQWPVPPGDTTSDHL